MTPASTPDFARLPVPKEMPTPYLLDPAAFPPPLEPAALDELLRRDFVKITDKAAPSPAASANDYVSYSQYWWPNPQTPDRLPFVRRDGDFNHDQIRLGDRARFNTMIDTLLRLTTAWQVTRDPACAARAVRWLQLWFADEATRMSPHLEYAQVRLGHNRNRGNDAGVLDGLCLVLVPQCLEQLHDAPALSPGDTRRITAWFAAYLGWLLDSENGRKEHSAPNNHGSWYLVQVVTFLTFVGRTAEARAFCHADFARIASQFAPDGSQPFEMARADALDYHIYNLEAQFHLAELASRLGLDLWNFTSAAGASLRTGLAYLAPYDARPETWPFAQKTKIRPGKFSHLIRKGKAIWGAQG